MYAITPTLNSLYTALIPFIISVTGLAATQVVLGIQNRVSMPQPGFINVQAVSRRRLATDVVCYDQTSDDPTTAGIKQSVQYDVQIDCYGSASSEWADMLSTLLRNNVGCVALAPNCQPLYADDARMMPLVNGEDQWEERWSLTAAFEVDPVVTAPQQYADALNITLIEVETIT